MATLKYEETAILVNICVKHMKSSLAPFAHIKDRAHFGTSEEVKERMRREKKFACSSFLGFLTEEEVAALVVNQLAIDVERAEAEALSFNRSTGRQRRTGSIIMKPLDERTEEVMDTGFIITFDSFDKEYSAPHKCHRIMVCATWETYEDGSVCEPTFQIETIFPIR